MEDMEEIYLSYIDRVQQRHTETAATLRARMCDWSTYDIERAMALVEQDLVDGYEDAEYAMTLIEAGLFTLETRSIAQEMLMGGEWDD